MKVVIEHQVAAPERGTRRKTFIWARAWVGELLYADRHHALVRSVGSHQSFDGIPTESVMKRAGRAGREIGMLATSWGWKETHPDILKLKIAPDRRRNFSSPGRIRISPASVHEMNQILKASGITFLTREDVTVERRSRVLYREQLAANRVRLQKDGAVPVCPPGRGPRAVPPTKASASGKKKACPKPNRSRRPS